MWKLIITDSFHFNQIGYNVNIYILYLNFCVLMQNMTHGYTIFFLILGMLSLLSPIHIAKGLYLCPLTENDRKKYLKSACLLRFVFHEVVLIVIMALLELFHQLEFRVLFLIFICVSVEFLALLLLTGFYNPEAVKKQYYIMNKLTPPTKKLPLNEKYQTPLNGIYLLTIALIFSCIGMVLPAFLGSYDVRWLLYYIPAFLICFLCMLFYFLRYFDLFITINANQEMYSYLRKKKVGAFHAD